MKRDDLSWEMEVAGMIWTGSTRPDMTRIGFRGKLRWFGVGSDIFDWRFVVRDTL